MVVIDAAWSVTLVVTHSGVEWTVDRNLKVVWSQSMALCVGIRKQTTLLITCTQTYLDDTKYSDGTKTVMARPRQ